MTSRTSQWPEAVGASQAAGADASASIWSDCSRTVRSRFSLLAKSLNSHSLMGPPLQRARCGGYASSDEAARATSFLPAVSSGAQRRLRCMGDETGPTAVVVLRRDGGEVLLGPVYAPERCDLALVDDLLR